MELKTKTDGKKDVWDSFVMAWMDYQKVFDSVPHKFSVIALILAKVLLPVILATKTLIQKWSENLHLTSHEGDIQSITIQCHRRTCEGDSLSLLLFILSVNPMLFLLKKLKRYQIRSSGKRDTIVNHFFTL